MIAIATDETVRFRKHGDGSMTILSKDGLTVLDFISADRLREACDHMKETPPARAAWSASMDDPTREGRGILLGMLLGGILWLPLGWLLFHG